jgi:hypothetical protein
VLSKRHLRFWRLRRGKGPIRAVPRPGAVSRHSSEMISSVRTQAANVGTNVPEGVSGLTLHRRGVSVTGRGAILEIDTRGQPMWVE